MANDIELFPIPGLKLIENDEPGSYGYVDLPEITVLESPVSFLMRKYGLTKELALAAAIQANLLYIANTGDTSTLPDGYTLKQVPLSTGYGGLTWGYSVFDPQGREVARRDNFTRNKVDPADNFLNDLMAGATGISRLGLKTAGEQTAKGLDYLWKANNPSTYIKGVGYRGFAGTQTSLPGLIADGARWGVPLTISANEFAKNPNFDTGVQVVVDALPFVMGSAGEATRLVKSGVNAGKQAIRTGYNTVKNGVNVGKVTLANGKTVLGGRVGNYGAGITLKDPSDFNLGITPKEPKLPITGGKVKPKMIRVTSDMKIKPGSKLYGKLGDDYDNFGIVKEQKPNGLVYENRLVGELEPFVDIFTERDLARLDPIYVEESAVIPKSSATLSSTLGEPVNDLFIQPKVTASTPVENSPLASNVPLDSLVLLDPLYDPRNAFKNKVVLNSDGSYTAMSEDGTLYTFSQDDMAGALSDIWSVPDHLHGGTSFESKSVPDSPINPRPAALGPVVVPLPETPAPSENLPNTMTIIGSHDGKPIVQIGDLKYLITDPNILDMLVTYVTNDGGIQTSYTGTVKDLMSRVYKPLAEPEPFELSSEPITGELVENSPISPSNVTIESYNPNNFDPLYDPRPTSMKVKPGDTIVLDGGDPLNTLRIDEIRGDGSLQATDPFGRNVRISASDVNNYLVVRPKTSESPMKNSPDRFGENASNYKTELMMDDNGNPVNVRVLSDGRYAYKNNNGEIIVGSKEKILSEIAPLDSSLENSGVLTTSEGLEPASGSFGSSEFYFLSPKLVRLIRIGNRIYNVIDGWGNKAVVQRLGSNKREIIDMSQLVRKADPKSGVYDPVFKDTKIVYGGRRLLLKGPSRDMMHYGDPDMTPIPGAKFRDIIGIGEGTSLYKPTGTWGSYVWPLVKAATVVGGPSYGIYKYATRNNDSSDDNKSLKDNQDVTTRTDQDTALSVQSDPGLGGEVEDEATYNVLDRGSNEGNGAPDKSYLAGEGLDEGSILPSDSVADAILNVYGEDSADGASNGASNETLSLDVTLGAFEAYCKLHADDPETNRIVNIKDRNLQWEEILKWVNANILKLINENILIQQ